MALQPSGRVGLGCSPEGRQKGGSPKRGRVLSGERSPGGAEGSIQERSPAGQGSIQEGSPAGQKVLSRGGVPCRAEGSIWGRVPVGAEGSIWGRGPGGAEGSVSLERGPWWGRRGFCHRERVLP